jgi:two-component system OmpR family response regulator
MATRACGAFGGKGMPGAKAAPGHPNHPDHRHVEVFRNRRGAPATARRSETRSCGRGSSCRGLPPRHRCLGQDANGHNARDRGPVAPSRDGTAAQESIGELTPGAHMRVLVVEDDSVLSAALTRALGQAAYAVDLAENGEDADLALKTDRYDLVVLDIALPGMHGLAVLRRLRDRGSRVPVLVLTARDTLEDRVDGLDLGADDYMTKPFDLSEFEARVRALLRRANYNGDAGVVHGQLRFDSAARRLFYADQPIDLSVRELAVIELLLSRQGRVVSKEQMIDRLFGWGDDVGSNAIEVYVHRVRRKLEPFGVEIRTVRGMGYLLDKVDGAA